ncbi:hypothetical protein K435DRAFT_854252 [Dendrothele bispora CBS 962.96]|uniref:Uncharacterized protein n=1 Tax=Dendrothele bispora (strain CBS 962.96) TaxID=1314807 RepID=A0A4S8MEI9_DENBC|nr:hypothetical protein K435DRAFT_854252 [Dendrothele bispora CBS 962.96]
MATQMTMETVTHPTPSPDPNHNSGFKEGGTLWSSSALSGDPKGSNPSNGQDSADTPDALRILRTQIRNTYDTGHCNYQFLADKI